MLPTSSRYRGFGVAWSSDTALDLFDLDQEQDAAADITVRTVGQLRDRAAGTPINAGFVFPDGFRVHSDAEGVFDVFDARRIEYRPTAQWDGVMPATFYGTVAALTLALRGRIPFHASAVEVDGRAILLTGAPGAGKSTLAAQMLGHGARLLSDDLSVVESSADGPLVCRGRSTIRLHREMAERVEHTMRCGVAGDPRGKWIVRPVARALAERVPLGGTILLGQPDDATVSARTVMGLAGHLFRPRWMEKLPGRAARLTAVMQIGTRLPMRGAAPPPGFHHDDETARRLLDRIVDMIASPDRR